jgi:phage anti-repressor protein
MNQLIKVDINKKFEQVVSGRRLHAFLEVKTEYSHWINRRIEDGGFLANEDFSPILTESTGGRPSADHALKLDMAKELCMLERNARGKEARQYFIKLEKDWNSPEKVMARALFIASGQIEQLKKELESAEKRAALREKSLTEAFRLLEGAAARIVKEVAQDPLPKENRRHYKAQKLPFALRRAIDRKLEEGATYDEIALYVRDMGNFISTSALQRYNYQRLHHPENLKT